MSYDSRITQSLIAELIASPTSFNKIGKAGLLLKQFFAGAPISKLAPLLTSEDVEIVRSAMWVASELGRNAAPLLPNVKLLLAHSDSRVRYFALEVATVAGGASQSGDAMLLALQDQDSVVRIHAMELAARVDSAKWAGLKEAFLKTENSNTLDLQASNELRAKFEAIEVARCGTVNLPAWMSELNAEPESDIMKFLARFRRRPVFR